MTTTVLTRRVLLRKATTNDYLQPNGNFGSSHTAKNFTLASTATDYAKNKNLTGVEIVLDFDGLGNVVLGNI